MAAMESAATAVAGKPAAPTAEPAAVSKASATKPAVTGKPAAIGIAAMVKSDVVKSAATTITAPVKPPIRIATTYKTTSAIRWGKTPAVASTKPTIVETTAVEITGIPSLKKRPIVGIVIVILVVPIPGRIVIISIPGKFIFICYCSGGIGVSIYIGILAHWRRCRIDGPYRKGKTNTCIHIYLRVALRGNQAGRDNGHECK